MNIDEMRMLVQAIEGRQQITQRYGPATVIAVDRDNAVATVRMDGQDFGDEVDVRPLIADVGATDRVMVAFDPPRGGYVIGQIGLPFSAGEVVLHVDRTTTASGVTNAAPADLLTSTVVFQPTRRYRIEFASQATAASGTPRAQLRLVLTTLDSAGAAVDTVLQSASVSLAADFTAPITKSVVVQPGDVSATLTLEARETLPSGSVNYVASAEAPTYMTVTDAGPQVTS